MYSGVFSRLQPLQSCLLYLNSNTRCRLYISLQLLTMSPGTWQSYERRDLVRDWFLLPEQALRSPELWRPCLCPTAHPNQPAIEVILQDSARKESTATKEKSNKVTKGKKRKEKQGKISRYFHNCLFNLYPEKTETSVQLQFQILAAEQHLHSEGLQCLGQGHRHTTSKDLSQKP